MLTPLTILSVGQGHIYDESGALAFAWPLDRLAIWNDVLRALLDHARQRLWFATRLRRLDASWRDVMLTYRMAAAG